MPADPAREIVRAVDRLTTQVRRLADAIATPVTDEPTTRADGRITCPTCRFTGVWAGVPLHWWNCPDRPARSRGADPEQRTPADCSTTAFRDALLVLLSRASRGVLTPDEGPLLRQHVEHLLRDRDHLAAAIDRVQQACHDLPYEHVRSVCTALDGPTTEACVL
ncbi:hypothetical protein AB0F64_37560 [Streptomyces sp. NPDC026294]|uniref:hypothetical protein n=1 Tax=Streptomyces sp. NPDC026294 TaxID=3155362 RepID=UPI0033D9C963